MRILFGLDGLVRCSRAWLYGTLFVALLSQKLTYVGKAISPWSYMLDETENSQRVA
jgi:hypothetical protein